MLISKNTPNVLLAVICCFGISGAAAQDSVSLPNNPSVSLQVVTPDTACSNPGLIAETSSGNVASCESGVWVSRSMSNPEIAVSTSAPFSGFGGGYQYTACPSGKRAVTAGCIVWPSVASNSDSNFGFIIDEITIAGGVYYGFPFAGDAGAYCLVVADTGNTATVAATAVCVDR